MRTRTIRTGLVAFVILCGSGLVVSAQNVGYVDSSPPASVQFTPSRDSRALGMVGHASKMLGLKVRDKDERAIGRLDDFVIEPQSGTVVASLISAGGKTVAVPADMLFPAGDSRVVLNAEKRDFEAAPKLENTMAAFSPSGLSRTFSFFREAHPLEGTQGEFVSARQLLGKSLSSTQNTKLGGVKDVVMDVSNRRAIYLLVGGAGSSGDVYPVPPEAVTVTGDGSQLVLTYKGDAQHLTSGPHLAQGFANEVVLPEYADQVYRHYGLTVPWKTAATAPTGRAEVQQPLTPTGRSDEEIRTAFLSEIVSGENAMPAVRAKELNVAVQNGRIILSGKTSGAKEKERLLSAARKIVGPANVEDRLTD